MMHLALLIALTCVGADADSQAVSNVKAEHRNGQTFVTWTDVAEGAAGAAYRYAVYRADRPITQADLAGMKPCVAGVLNNAAVRFGHAFDPKKRIDPKTPMAVIREGGEPLPHWSGLAVVTPPKSGKAWYAVVATDRAGTALTRVVPGESATTEPIEETVAPIQPVKIIDAKDRRAPYSRAWVITGKQGLALSVSLHASSWRGGGASRHGDYYLYWARPEWGWRQGLPGVFSVKERTGTLILESRDAIVCPKQKGPLAFQTRWFGYSCVPQWADHAAPRAYNFTEQRVLWLIDWTIRRYGADPDRVTCGGGSMGAWGSMTFAMRHPEVFAAVYPNRPRTRQRFLPSLARCGDISGSARDTADAKHLMADGVTPYFQRMDMVRFVSEHRGDLPFLGWCCGRRDGFASWQEQVDMVKALAEARHGFAFAWNNGNHSSGAAPMRQVTKWYPASRFARNVSYPAFSRSSIDDDPGPGDPKAGDMTGGINLGFAWKDVVDSPDTWAVTLSNGLCAAPMTVDVTPRRCQSFKPKPGEALAWTAAAGASGSVAADRWGLVTVEKVAIKPGEEVRVAVKRRS